MKVLAMIDSFKGCATSAELNQAVLEGLPETIWQQKINVPIADGGEGTMAAIYDSLGGNWIEVATVNHLMQPLKAAYLLTTIEGEKAAVIESAAYIGIDLSEPSDDVVRQGTSFGLGAVIHDALDKKVQRIYLSLGGSGTSDGGLGLLQALGGKILPETSGNSFLSIESIDLATITHKLKSIQFFALADVTNPYAGLTGFATVFGPQKGATQKTVNELESQAQKLTTFIKEQYQLDLSTIPGTGAAGGLGGAVVLLGGEIVSGFETIQQLIGLEKLMVDADLIFTGEGRIDGQTSQGKVPYGVAKMAQEKQIPVIALCGSRTKEIDDLASLMLGVFSIQPGPISLAEAKVKETALYNIKMLAADLSRVFCRK